MRGGSSVDTGATWPCCSDLDIAADQAHLPVPIVCLNCGGCGSWGYYHNQQKSQRWSSCCCCCCMSFCRVCSWAVMTITVTRFLRVAVKLAVCSEVSGPWLSKDWIANIYASALSGCLCPVKIPWGRNSSLFPKVGFQGFLLNNCCRKYVNTTMSILRFML